MLQTPRGLKLLAARIGLRLFAEHSVITVAADAAAVSDVTLAVNSCSLHVLLPFTVGCNEARDACMYTTDPWICLCMLFYQGHCKR